MTACAFKVAEGLTPDRGDDLLDHMPTRARARRLVVRLEKTSQLNKVLPVLRRRVAEHRPEDAVGQPLVTRPYPKPFSTLIPEDIIRRDGYVTLPARHHHEPS
jgi:hypothetical protein